jgi:putative ABC transport system substrate-binding protein
MPVIGFLSPVTLDTVADDLRGFRHGLKDTGYVEGENVAIEYRWAEDRIDRLPALATGLVHRRPTLIATHSSGAFAAKEATATIPIVKSRTAAKRIDTGRIRCWSRRSSWCPEISRAARPP